MESFIIFFSLTIIINYIQNQNPVNITTFHIAPHYKILKFYELIVSKNEIFGFEFEKNTPRGFWKRGSLNKSSKIQFLYSKDYDPFLEEYLE